jgi:xanthine dehydrogenase accessory factor
METILAHLDHWQREGEEIAIATVVRMAGSAPRMPGARMCMTRSGKVVGSVSGGCVETDVLEHARLVLDAGRPALVNYGIADELGLRVGLSCGGSIDVLIEPFVEDEAWHALRHAYEARRPAALAVALAPGDLLGRKLVVPGAGPAVGSIAPDLDESVAAAARDMLGRDGTRVLNIPRDGETAEVFVQSLPLPFRLYVVGATDTAVRLCTMAKEVGFHITVIDARETFATRDRFPAVDELLLAWPQDVLKDLPLDEHAYVVTLTHDPKFDIPALTYALRSGARYIGAMGSRKTHERRKARLLEEGFTDAEVDRIHAPIGLDIGGHTPAEMALSILAEIVAARYGRQGGPLQRRGKGIHDNEAP